MSRCDYEGVFYRVFCVGLLVIAFTFTVILTNVFIDIDGLLTRKEQESQATEHATPSSFVDKHEGKVNTERPPEKDYVIKNYDDEGVYRTKRSLDSTDFLLHIKNPKIKNVLANRLATLLEELDEDESKSEITETSDKPKIDIDDIYVKTDKHIAKEARHKTDMLKKEIKLSERNDDNVLHTAMHNLLREGIVEHMDFNSVYKKVHALVRSFQNSERKQKENDEAVKHSNREKFDDVTLSPRSINEENKFIEELIKCKKLQEEVTDLAKEKRKEDIAKANAKSPKFLIKTLIDIQKNDKEIDSTSKENFKGIIKLIYNGKSLKVKSMDEYESTTKPNKEETTTHTLNTVAEEMADMLKVNIENRHFSKSYMNSIFSEYLKKFIKIHDVPEPHNEKRLKRNIKLNDENQTDKNKMKNDKIDDDELFVEIETHFDNKGIKGKKKGELVKQLIEKIQKAIRSNQEENKQLKHLNEIHVKKRVQNPLEHKNESHHSMLKDILIPFSSTIYRELYPISKIGTANDPLPAVSNSESWIKKETGPKFISSSKSINSAELSQIDVDFKKVMEISGIPQRLQIPLNTDLSGENPNAYFDLGNLQYLIKDLEGSGFSIGVNQYVDHAPDPESIKLFTGIEKLVSKYNHDQSFLAGDLNRSDDIPKHEMKKRDLNVKKYGNNIIKNKVFRHGHKVSRRSVYQGNNYHSNEYNFLYQDNNLPYTNYQDIIEDKQKKVSFSINNMKTNNQKYEDIDENEILTKRIPKDFEDIFEKKLKPSEIFNLASLLDRKKRSVHVHKFNSLNKRIKMSTFINTNARAKQRLIFKGKRNKRQVGKIRIIAKNTRGNSESDENIYIVSDENMYADRAVIRRLSVPNNSANEDKAEEQVDEPILFENTKPPLFDVFEESVRRNPLMLKYPHIFLDEMNDKFRLGTPTNFEKISQPLNEFEITTENDGKVEKMPKVQDLLNALTPFPKTNYKVTMKLLPKDNITHAGFREIHTCINKTFNKDGMLYSSLVNVSEISKIESSNDSASFGNNYDDKPYIMLATTPNNLQNKHEALKSIIKEHRDRINKQLENLNKEKERLSSFMLKTTYETTTERKSELMDILLNFNDSKVLRLNKDDIGKLICNAVKQQENSKTTTVTTTIKPDLTTTSKLTMDPLKIKLLKAISQNEQLTSQILTKIDQNSVILQSFLSKITDKIQELPDITRQAIIEHENKMKFPREPLHLNYPNHHYFVKLPNTTDLGIPFIYYQQPTANPQRSKVENPGTNIVGNSYINPNPIHNNKMYIAKTNSEEFKNFDGDLVHITNDSTKYFVDDDYFRTIVSPADKINLKKPAEDLKSDVINAGDQQHTIFFRKHLPKPRVKEYKNGNETPYKLKSNADAAVNVTKSV